MLCWKFFLEKLKEEQGWKKKFLLEILLLDGTRRNRLSQAPPIEHFWIAPRLKAALIIETAW